MSNPPTGIYAYLAGLTEEPFESRCFAGTQPLLPRLHPLTTTWLNSEKRNALPPLRCSDGTTALGYLHSIDGQTLRFVFPRPLEMARQTARGIKECQFTSLGLHRDGNTWKDWWDFAWEIEPRPATATFGIAAIARMSALSEL